MFQNFMHEQIEGDGAYLFVRRAGPENAPPLVLLHGYPQTSAMWHSVAPILAQSYQVVAQICEGMADQINQPQMLRINPIQNVLWRKM